MEEIYDTDEENLKYYLRDADMDYDFYIKKITCVLKVICRLKKMSAFQRYGKHRRIPFGVEEVLEEKDSSWTYNIESHWVAGAARDKSGDEEFWDFACFEEKCFFESLNKAMCSYRHGLFKIFGYYFEKELKEVI